jgi:hypothetical protein
MGSEESTQNVVTTSSSSSTSSALEVKKQKEKDSAIKLMQEHMKEVADILVGLRFGAPPGKLRSIDDLLIAIVDMPLKLMVQQLGCNGALEKLVPALRKMITPVKCDIDSIIADVKALDPKLELNIFRKDGRTPLADGFSINTRRYHKDGDKPIAYMNDRDDTLPEGLEISLMSRQDKQAMGTNSISTALFVRKLESLRKTMGNVPILSYAVEYFLPIVLKKVRFAKLEDGELSGFRRTYNETMTPNTAIIIDTTAELSPYDADEYYGARFW